MNIKELREKNHLTQTALAKSLGVSSNTISAIEGGRLKLSAKLAGRIEEVYGAVIDPATAAKKTAKRGRKPKAKPVAEKKPRKAAAKKQRAPEIVIQSPVGGEITPEAILEKIGQAEKVYIRVDQNKAYWVNGEETGSVDLW